MVSSIRKYSIRLIKNTLSTLPFLLLYVACTNAPKTLEEKFRALIHADMEEVWKRHRSNPRLLKNHLRVTHVSFGTLDSAYSSPETDSAYQHLRRGTAAQA